MEGISFDDAVTKYKAFVASFSKEDSWDWWETNSRRQELGIYQVSKASKKMSFRAYDDSPSVAINGALRYKDFGSDESGDPVTRIMNVGNMNFHDAVILFLSWDGTIVTGNYQKAEAKVEEKNKPYQLSYLKNMILNKLKFKNDYDLLAKDLFRGCSDEEQRYAEKVLHVGFEPKKEEFCSRIFIPEMNVDGIPYGSYRYNRNDSSKGLLRKNSKRVLFGSHMLPKYGKKVLYVEGHSDAVINIAKRYASLTTGSATKKMEENIEMLKGKIVYDFPDLDIPGIKGATTRASEIMKYNEQASDEDKIVHHIFLWASWMNSSTIYNKIVENKIDRNDPFKIIADKIPLKKEHAHINIPLFREIQVEHCEKKGIDITNVDINNWRVIFKGESLKEGYDFADFHVESESKKSSLLNFLDVNVKF